MIYWYACYRCIEKELGKPVTSLSVADFKIETSKHALRIEHQSSERAPQLCPICNHELNRLVSVNQTYVRGYGLADRKGAINDMNLYKMTMGQDPYKEYRPKGDGDELISKLRKAKEFNPKARRVFLK